MNIRAEPYVNACPVGCSAPIAATSIVVAEGALRRCSGCGQLLSAASAARYAETMEQFNAEHFNAPQGRELARRQSVAHRRLSRIAALIGKPPAQMRVLDVGCSRGQFVAAAIAEGYRAEGVEPAPRIAEAARAAGLPVKTGLLEDQHYPDASFDALTLFEVIEHLRQPLPLLAECRRVLKPGGILLVSTANAESWTAAVMGARWDYFDMEKDGGHISFYNPRSMAKIAVAAGFEVARLDTARVKFGDKETTPRGRYVMGKLVAELLNLPARLCGRGHDLLAYLRKPSMG
jgi:2-polyprenyl-3-methyl-5-hydroxy-6-metoxy-1,4-benzoquinol methylase